MSYIPLKWLWLCLLMAGISLQAQNTFINAIEVGEDGSVELRFTLAPQTDSYTIWRLQASSATAIYQANGATDKSYADNSANALLQSYSYYITAQLTDGSTQQTKTWSTTLLSTQDGNNGCALLQWNASYPPHRTYEIWRAPLNGIYSKVGSTQAHSYTDTLSLCQAERYYKIIYKVGNEQCVSNIHGQTFKNLSPPTSVIPLNISLNSDDGSIQLTWQAPPAADSDIQKFQVWEMNAQNQSTQNPIQEIYDPNATSARLMSQQLCDSAIVLSVTAQDSCGNSSVWQPAYFFRALHLKPLVYDLCHDECHLRWDPIPSWQQQAAEGVRVFKQENDQPFVMVAELPATATTYTLGGFQQQGTRFRFYIESYNTSLNRSSRSCTRTLMGQQAATFDAMWIQAATVLQGKTHIQWNTQGQSPSTHHFVLQRGTDGQQYSNISEIKPNSSGQYISTDNNASYYKQSYYYRLQNVDSCNNIIQTSAAAKTIYAQCEAAPNYKAHISWSPYQAMNAVQYHLYQQLKPTSTPQLLASFDAQETLSWTIDLHADMPEAQTGISFYVEAIGTHDETPHKQDTARSNSCFVPNIFKIVLPTAFNPRGTHNITYKPLCYGISPQGYHFVVINDKQEVVYETKDINASWDGRINGTLCPSGSLFVAVVKGLSYNGKNIEKQSAIVVL